MQLGSAPIVDYGPKGRVAVRQFGTGAWIAPAANHLCNTVGPWTGDVEHIRVGFLETKNGATAILAASCQTTDGLSRLVVGRYSPAGVLAAIMLPSARQVTAVLDQLAARAPGLVSIETPAGPAPAPTPVSPGDGAGADGLRHAPALWHPLIREAVALQRSEPVPVGAPRSARLRELVALPALDPRRGQAGRRNGPDRGMTARR